MSSFPAHPGPQGQAFQGMGPANWPANVSLPLSLLPQEGLSLSFLPVPKYSSNFKLQLPFSFPVLRIP